MGGGEREREGGRGLWGRWRGWGEGGGEERVGEWDRLARLRPRELLPGGLGEVWGGGRLFGVGGGLFGVGGWSSPQWEIRAVVYGLSALLTGTLASVSMTVLPDMTCPNTVCLAFRCSQGDRVMKNLVEVRVSIYRYCSMPRASAVT